MTTLTTHAHSAPQRSAGSAPELQLPQRGEDSAGLVLGRSQLADRAPPLPHRLQDRCQRGSRSGGAARADRERAAGGVGEQVEDVLDAQHRRRAALDQPVGARRLGARDPAGDRADGPAQLGGEVGGGERAGALRRLDHDRDAGEAGDDPVARDEAPAHGPKPGGISDTTAPRSTTCAYSWRLLGGYGTSAPLPDGDDGSAGLQRAGVRRGVDAEREARDHRHAGGGEAAAERAGDLEPVRGRAAGADDRHRVLLIRQPPGDVQHRGRVGELAQPLRVGVVAAGRPALEPRPSRSAVPARASKSAYARSTAERAEREQRLVRQRQHAGGHLALAPLHVEVARQVRDEGGAPQACVAGLMPLCERGGLEAEAGGEDDVLWPDGVAALEVGDRARDAEDAAVAAGAEPVAVVELVQEAHGARGRLGVLAQQPGGHLGVAGEAVLGEAVGLALAGGDHALPHRGGGGRLLGAQRLGRRPADADQHVDPVQQRARQAAVVAGEVGGGAATVLVAHPAWARVRRGDEHEPGRERHHLLAADDRHAAVLERLAQRLQARADELAQLVEEKDAVVGERRLSRRAGASRRRPGRRRRSCGAASGTDVR